MASPPPASADEQAQPGPQGTGPRRPRRLVLRAVLAVGVLAVAGGVAVVAWPDDGDRDGRRTDDVGPTLPCQPGDDLVALDLGEDGDAYTAVTGAGDDTFRLAAGDRLGPTEQRQADERRRLLPTRPTFSPDGTELVVMRSQSDDYELAGPTSTSLWRIGTSEDPEDAPERLTRPADRSGRGYDDEPAWSPDGRTIAFSRSTDDPRRRLALVPAGGGEVEVLTDPGELDDRLPTWSADGTHLAFLRGNRIDGWTLWTVAADGTDPQQRADANAVPSTPGAGAEPTSLSWSPDGRSILVSYAGQAEPVDLVDVASGHRTTIAPVGTLATWSRDGRRILLLAPDPDGPPPALDGWNDLHLAVGHLDDGRLAIDRSWGPPTAYRYDYFGLAVGPCRGGSALEPAAADDPIPGRACLEGGYPPQDLDETFVGTTTALAERIALGWHQELRVVAVDGTCTAPADRTELPTGGVVALVVVDGVIRAVGRA